MITCFQNLQRCVSLCLCWLCVNNCTEKQIWSWIYSKQIGHDLHFCERFAFVTLPPQVILSRGFLSTWCQLIDSYIISVFLLSWLLVHCCFFHCHTFFFYLSFSFFCLLNICLPKLINSTGYWLPGLKQVVCAQSTHVPKLNYQQRAYYPTQPNYPHFQSWLSQDITREFCSKITGMVHCAFLKTPEKRIQISHLLMKILERRLAK